jgi:hypothetical protein
MKPQAEWAFAVWSSLPAIWSEVAAFSFAQGEWRPANFDQVGLEGRSSTRETLEIEFGKLAELPRFPSAEVEAAYRIEEKRLRSQANLSQPQTIPILANSGARNQEKLAIAKPNDLYSSANLRFPLSALNASSLRSSKKYPR